MTFDTSLDSVQCENRNLYLEVIPGGAKNEVTVWANVRRINLRKHWYTVVVDKCCLKCTVAGSDGENVDIVAQSWRQSLGWLRTCRRTLRAITASKLCKILTQYIFLVLKPLAISWTATYAVCKGRDLRMRWQGSFCLEHNKPCNLQIRKIESCRQ